MKERVNLNRWERDEHYTRSKSRRAAEPVDQNETIVNAKVVCNVLGLDLQNYNDVMRSAKCASWKDTMSEELKALEADGVWELVNDQNKSMRSAHSGCLKHRRTRMET